MRACQSKIAPSNIVELDNLHDEKGKPLGVAYMVGRLDRALNRQFRRALEPLGLTIGQYTALSVFCSSGRLSNAKLAESTMVSPQAANELIKGMEKNGWIVREPDPNHKRIINISLTSQGVKLLSRCNKVIASLERQMLSQFSDKEIAVLHRNLRSAVSVMKKL
jgi:DNA-binding MarR family transcriptional regulator